MIGAHLTPKQLNRPPSGDKRGRSLHKRVGGKRKDRCFRVYLVMPEGVTEDAVMDLLEEAVASHVHNLGINPDTVTVKRHSPRPYG